MAVFVIVIDDSHVIRKILETCLRRAGYETRSFEDGVEALRWLHTPFKTQEILAVVQAQLGTLVGRGAEQRAAEGAHP
jgi:DNA-binding NtrC family response regulator